MSHTANNSGKIGEKIAAYYLIMKGYRVIETNYRTRRGEIDLICRRGKNLIFVEVKTRTNNLGGYPEEAVTPVKLQRMEAAIIHYLQTKKINDLNIQIDVVGIEFSKLRMPRIHHIPNINFDS